MISFPPSTKASLCHRIILVLVIGGRDFITPKRRQRLYLIYKWYIFCQLGEYMLPTTFYKNPKILYNKFCKKMFDLDLELFAFGWFPSGSKLCEFLAVFVGRLLWKACGNFAECKVWCFESRSWCGCIYFFGYFLLLQNYLEGHLQLYAI